MLPLSAHTYVETAIAFLGLLVLVLIWFSHLMRSVLHGMQLNEAIKTSIASVESPGRVLPSEVPQRTAQLPLRQKVSWYGSQLPAPKQCYKPAKPLCLLPGTCTACSIVGLMFQPAVLSSAMTWN